MTQADALQIEARLTRVTAAIEAACRKAGRAAGSVTLVAVGKTHGLPRIEQALRAGQRVFGENRVQEAQAKFPALKKAWPDLSLHLIGPLQTNKAQDAVVLFDAIQSLDRPKLAYALARAMARTGRRPACLLQVNTGEEPQKAGCLPQDLEALYRLSREELGLEVQGLMCIPPLNEPPAPHFQFLRQRARGLGLPLLSMGMSADFPAGILLGATHIRVGTAIFGNRPAPTDARPP